MSFRTAFVAVALGLPLGLSAIAPVAAQKAPPTTGETSATGSGDLSSKLSKSDGVIAPKGDVDPGIKAPAPAPHPNSTPVIPPSATGGNSAK